MTKIYRTVVEIVPPPARKAIRILLRAVRLSIRNVRQTRRYLTQYRQLNGPLGFFSTSLHVLSIIRAQLQGHHRGNNDLKYLIYRSPDVFEYLLNDISPNTSDIEDFYKHFDISKTRINFEELNQPLPWGRKNVHKVAGLARYLVLSQISNDNIVAGLNLYGYLLRHSKKDVFRSWLVEPHLQHQKVFLDGLVLVGAFDEWKTANEALTSGLKHLKSVSCDAENPFIELGTNTSEDVWLRLFNEYFYSHGLQKVELNAIGSVPFDRLSTSELPKVQGPLVSVIVSAYNPGSELISAVQSLIDQTWENIEILIVDDFSSETDYLDRARTMDPRIKVLRQSSNMGTYAARNLGIRNSSGGLITTHDSDDWAHPQRIEFQAKNLLASEKHQANLSWCIRVTSDLRVSTLGFSETRVNASSLMFRRELIEKIGYFDEVRKGADSEFRMRIAAQYPEGVSIIGFQPLSIIRIGHQSLSRSDFSPLWIHPNRHFYKHSYEMWHKTKNFTDFQNPAASKTYRPPFPAPVAFLNDSGSSNAKDFDIVVAANFSSEFESENAGIRTIKHCIQKDIQVGALNIKPLKLSEPFDSGFQELVFFQKIQWLSQDTVATAKKLVVVDPEFLLLRSFLPQRLDAQEIEIQVRSLQGILDQFEKILGIRIELKEQHKLKDLILKIQENAVSLYQKNPSWSFTQKEDFELIESLSITTVNSRLDPANT